ncbi:MAG: tRNA pseudouridine(13) synthase TruD [Candidatus Altiarchaeota archaeon]|nr:tRNA pseudouridine(13) synthase TruD [Candidatus Altiarchaeota archaeon]
MKTPEPDRLIGLGVYLSKTKGIGGRIKEAPEDFLVEEITPEGRILEIGKEQKPQSSGGDYTTFTLEKTNWETLRAIKMIARGCNTSRKRFKFAGTKDRRAISTQRVSAWKVPVDTLGRVGIKDLVLRDFAHSQEPINLGSLSGNRFTVVIRGVETGADKKIQDILNKLGGKFPNFFGQQRFGTRFNTHLVGKAILSGDFKEAAMLYLADPGCGSEPEEALEARDKLRESGDFKQALLEFPKYLGYEKSMLNHLVNTPNDYIGALRKLPKKLRWMFIHAYQAYIFNIALSQHIKECEIPEKLQLVGYGSPPDDFIDALLAREGIEKGAFKIRPMPELSSEGEIRDSLSEYKDFEITDFKEKDANITVRFILASGSYATMLLRELMKT